MESTKIRMTAKMAGFYLSVDFLIRFIPVVLAYLISEAVYDITRGFGAMIPYLHLLATVAIVGLYLFIGFRHSISSYVYVLLLILIGSFVGACCIPVFNIATGEYRLTGVGQFFGWVLGYFSPLMIFAVIVFYLIGCLVQFLI